MSKPLYTSKHDSFAADDELYASLSDDAKAWVDAQTNQLAKEISGVGNTQARQVVLRLFRWLYKREV